MSAWRSNIAEIASVFASMQETGDKRREGQQTDRQTDRQLFRKEEDQTQMAY